MTYYSVTVPPNADYATNLLLSSTEPVNMWFNQNKVPVALSPPDYLLISNATNGVAILSATSTPPLVPGATYYLAIQDTNAATATFALEVQFPYLHRPDQRRADDEFRSAEQLCLLYGDGADECGLRHQPAALCQPARERVVQSIRPAHWLESVGFAPD